MMALLFILFFIIALLAFVEESISGKYKRAIFWGLAFILVLVAGLREVGLDKDSENYELYFNNTDDTKLLLVVEASYMFIAKILKHLFDDVHSVFLLYALFGVGLKFWAIKKLSPVYFLPVLLYFSNYFILHEMTQIRAGIASGLFLLALIPQAEGKKLKAVVLLLAALLFHYSSIILFVVLLFSNKEIEGKWLKALLLIIPVGYICHSLNIGITSIPIPYISRKIEIYTEMRDKGIMGDEAINVFNALTLVKIAVFYYLIFMRKTLLAFNKYSPLMLKIEGLSLFCFLFFADMPVFAFRLSELYGIVEIILMSNIYFTLKPKWASKLVVIGIALCFLAFNLFHNELLDF